MLIFYLFSLRNLRILPVCANYNTVIWLCLIRAKIITQLYIKNSENR